MALSGSYTNPIRTGYGLKLVWTATQNIPNNTSTITVNAYLSLTNASITIGARATGAYITIDGVKKPVATQKVSVTKISTGDYFLGQSSQTITHLDTGARSFLASMEFPILATLSGTYYSTVYCYLEGTLDTIPRYTTISNFKTNTITRSGFDYSFSVANTIDHWQYSLNGETWTGGQTGDRTSGTGSFTALSANTTYILKVRVRRKDSQLYTEQEVSVKTVAKASPNAPALTSRTATSAVFSWSATQTVTNVQYRVGTGPWINTVVTDFAPKANGSFAVSGLLPNTSNLVSIQVKDAEHGSYSGASNGTTVVTYKLSTASGSAFNLGSNVVATVVEPDTSMYHNIKFQYYNANTLTWVNGPTKNNQALGATFLASEIPISAMELANPNTKSVRCRFITESLWGSNGALQGSTTSTEFLGTIVGANPTIGAVTYADTNASMNTLKGPGYTNLIIRNKSTVRFNIASATSIKGAKLNRYTIVCNGSTYSNLISGSPTSQGSTNIDIGTINSSTNADAVVTVYDSRENFISVTVPIKIIDWEYPQIVSVSADRQNNFERPTTLNLTARFKPVVVNGVEKNSITVKYQWREKGVGSYSSLVDCGVLTPSTNGNWKEVFVNKLMGTFETDKEYDINIQFNDYPSGNLNYYLLLSKGVGLFEIYQDRMEFSIPITDGTTNNPYLYKSTTTTINTFQNGWEGYLILSRYGDLVSIKGALSKTGTVTNGTQIAVIPVDFRPHTTTPIAVAKGNTSPYTSSYLFWLTTGGGLVVRTSDTIPANQSSASLGINQIYSV